MELQKVIRKRINRSALALLSLFLTFTLLTSLFPMPVHADEGNQPDIARVFRGPHNQEIAEVVIAGRPPRIKAAVASVPEAIVQGATGTLSDVPAFNWSYGCSATSAAMLFGFYDRTGYPDMYTGPYNGGVCPLDNSYWGAGINGSDGQMPLSATRQGLD
jgi:hypothetical protein